MLERWWAVHGHRELFDTLDELKAPKRGDNAWDLVRFIVVARLATGAGFLANDDSWERIFPVLARLQACYTSWPELAQAYVVARRQWREVAIDGSEDDQQMRRIIDNIAQLSDTQWGATPFHLAPETDS